MASNSALRSLFRLQLGLVRAQVHDLRAPILSKLPQRCNSPSSNHHALRARSFHTNRARYGSEFLLDRQTAQRIEEESRDFPYAVHTAEFTTCELYYQALSTVGQNMPLTGVDFSAAYVDTHPDASPSKPTVLALHGTPGTHLDFKELTKFLDGKGVRVIALNFPGFGMTPVDKGRYFMHTQSEKAIYVNDFLSVIKVPKVDMVVTHSSGVYPGLLLSCSYNFVDCMAMINPGSLQRIEKMKPKWLFELASKGYRHTLSRFLTLIVLKAMLVATGYGNTNAHHMSVAFETLINVDFGMSLHNAMKLASQNFKAALIYSKNDRVVTLEQFEQYVKVFGARDETAYDVDGKITKSATETGSNFESHRFEGGGHFVMKKYPETVNNIVYNMLKKTRPELK